MGNPEDYLYDEFNENEASDRECISIRVFEMIG